jgi:lipoate-protein ligase A
MNWYFLNTGFHDGHYNMSLDERIAKNYKGIPILRVYGWEPYCISLGYNQGAEDINVAYANSKGISIVKRATGGRAVLHAEELTYSVILDSNGKGIHEVYKEINAALLQGLHLLGADVNFSKTNSDFNSLYKNKSSIPCFTSSARYEIEYEGKKLVGSAQRRYEDVVLQHGSILIGDFHKQLPDFLNCNVDNKTRETIEKDIDERTITLNNILSKKVSFTETADAIKIGFEKEYKIKFKEIDLEELCL